MGLRGGDAAAGMDLSRPLAPADYINFLKNVTISSVEENLTQLRRFNMGQPGEADCPVFDGLYQYCQVGSAQAPPGPPQAEARPS